jgi:hypothetical protein
MAYFAERATVGFPPEPTEPLLRHYNTRRAFYIAKLSMIMSAAEGVEQTIEKRHIEQAEVMLFEAELSMPKAIIGVGDNRNRIHEERAVQFVITWTELRKAPMPEARLRRFLSHNLDSFMIPAVIEGLINSGRLKAGGKEPTRMFRPGVGSNE